MSRVALVVVCVLGGALVAPADADAPASGAPRVLVEEARKLFPTAPKSCTDIACMIEDAYADDTKAKAHALALFQDVGDVAGVGPEEVMDGGYRGKIHLVPQLPKGKYRQHVEWVATARKAIDAFFVQLFDGQAPPAYRW